jgi:HSP20 family molecular chaperone IbpA
MVEDIIVTPFFRRHAAHMPATIKLHAEMREDKRDVILEAGLAGYSREDVEVSATPNTIEVTLVLERNDEGDVRFHNSYFTPVPIRHEKITVEHGSGRLKVTAPKC